MNLNPSLSGDGRIVTFESTANLAGVGGGNGFRAIRADLSANTDVFTQLGMSRAVAPAVSQDGSRIAFASNEDLVGSNPDRNSEIFLFDGSGVRQITNTTPADISTRIRDGNFQPSITDDGRVIAFASNRNLTRVNADLNFEIVVVDMVTSVFTQLTNSQAIIGSTEAKISGDGSHVVFLRDGSQSQSNSRDLLLYDRTSGRSIAVATNRAALSMTYGRAISDDGSRVVYSAETGALQSQVFLFDARSNSTTQVTALSARANDVPLHPTISGDGKRIAFATRRNVIGGNNDRSVELYVYDTPTGQITKLTDAPAAATAEVVSSLNDDGSIAVFSFPRVLSGSVSSNDLADNSEIYVATNEPRPAFGTLVVFNGAALGNEPGPDQTIAPDSIAIAKGTALSSETRQAERSGNGTFPLSLAGTTTTVNSRAARILFVSPTQVTFVVPLETELGAAEVLVKNSEGFQSRANVIIMPSAPGVFSVNGDGRGEGVILNADTLQSGPFDPTSGQLRLLVFATGARGSSEVFASIDGRALSVESIQRSRDLPGLDELHILIPPDLRGAGTVVLSVSTGMRQSNGVQLTLTGSSPTPSPSPEPSTTPTPFPSPTPSPSPTLTPPVVISEFRTRGPNGASDEFVELYNNSDMPIAIANWKIRGSSSAGAIGTRVTINAGTVIPARGHFLATHAGYGGSVVGDKTYPVGFANDGGIALTLPDDSVVDQVGLSVGSAFKEGMQLAPLPSDSNQSYERRPGGFNGSTQDMNDNLTDFQLLTPSDPQNTSSVPTPGPSPSPTPAPSPSASPTPGATPSSTPTPSATPSPSPSPSPTPLARIVISQIYGGGGNAGAPFRNDFIELFNAGTTTMSLAGWSIQYASATGISWSVTNLTSVSIAPGQYYLIQESSGGSAGANLPTPDATGTTGMAATGGKVALVNISTAISGPCPTDPTIVDLVGYGGTANCFRGAGPTASPSNTNSILRRSNGCTNTENNVGDFATGAPNPRNINAPASACAGAVLSRIVFANSPPLWCELLAVLDLPHSPHEGWPRSLPISNCRLPIEGRIDS
ncbi:MAG: lamin tail domain-containing protein [Pyrinomonadaceae bacterium]|nr:lamin tail domain-containing protein [Pyrinomonadaceae bacterium]